MSGGLGYEEVKHVFEDRQLRRVFEAFEVNCCMPFEYIWPIIDLNDDGTVDGADLTTLLGNWTG